MKRFVWLAAVFAAVTVSVSGQGRGAAMMTAAAGTAPQLTFHLDEDFFKLPDNIWPSEAVGVALNAKGHIFLLNRGNHPLLEFNPDGSFVRSIGEGRPRHAARAVQHAAQHRDGPQPEPLRGRSAEQPRAGVRHGREVQDGMGPRRPDVVDVHHARPDAGDLHRQRGQGLQDGAGRKGARHVRQARTAAGLVRLDPRDRVPGRQDGLHRERIQLPLRQSDSGIGRVGLVGKRTSLPALPDLPAPPGRPISASLSARASSRSRRPRGCSPTGSRSR